MPRTRPGYHDLIKQWLKLPAVDTRTLHEYMGLTEVEYLAWVTNQLCDLAEPHGPHPRSDYPIDCLGRGGHTDPGGA